MNIKSALAGVAMGLTASGVMAQEVLTQAEKVRQAVECIKEVGGPPPKGLCYDHSEGDGCEDREWYIPQDDEGRTFNYVISDSKGVLMEFLSIIRELPSSDGKVIRVSESDITQKPSLDNTHNLTDLDGIGERVIYELNSNDLNGIIDHMVNPEYVSQESGQPINLDPLIAKCSPLVG